MSIEYFIEKSKKIHANKYNYDNVNYINNCTKVDLICNICKTKFSQLPTNHYRGNGGCPKCKIKIVADKKKYTKELFIEKCNLIHKNKYDYTDIEYNRIFDKIKILCKKCGEYFVQLANDHLRGAGCTKCFLEKRKLTNEEFIEKSIKIHFDKYDYSLINYINTYQKIKIICKKHGEFHQSPTHHLQGSGCPLCNSSKGEIYIKNFLDKNKINYKSQFRINECRNKIPLPFDFAIFIEDKMKLIEFNGIQHYSINKRSKDINKNKKNFENIQLHDKIKKDYCKENNIPLLVIKYDEIDSMENILKDFIF